MISNVVVAIEDDIRCLKGIKAAFKDPQGQGRLESWDLHNSSVGLICKLSGVSCWNGKEDRLISISIPECRYKRPHTNSVCEVMAIKTKRRLSQNEQSGQIPDSLQYCASLQILDLSGNKISGTIPSQICTWLPYLTTLNISGNQLSGSVPPNLANYTYLYKLRLSNNRLSSKIPYELSSLLRL
ncbi:hypothetical protein MKW92_022153 [Papaver armeniacum]|nr:hypothetical protein MKW92_022153 [Papaver armeniacum]